MHLVDFRVIASERAKRQSLIKELAVHAHGHCIHVGKISFACGWCFAKKEMFQLSVGTQCTCRDNCPSCFFGSCSDGRTVLPYRDNLAELFECGLRFEWRPEIFSYNSWGETLLALNGADRDVFLKAAAVVQRIEERHGYKIYKKLYTNGLLADEDTLAFLKNGLDITEIRFHVSASMFSETVYQHMETARAMGFVLVVEEPSLPCHRDQLFEMLSRLEAIGVKHLDICEVEITENNIQRLHELLPDGRMYKNMAYHLYDEGLAYDLIEEAIRKEYTFSVIDCNSDRERFARSGRDEALDLEDLEDVFAAP